MRIEIIKEFLGQGPMTVQVTGVCMHSALPAGSDVRLEKKSIYWPGDIIAVRRGDHEVVSHRFLGYFPGRKCWRVITQADSAGAADGPVSVKDVLGRVTHVDCGQYRPSMKNRAKALANWLPAGSRCVVAWLVAIKSTANTSRLS